MCDLHFRQIFWCIVLALVLVLIKTNWIEWSYGTLEVQIILNYQSEKQWRGLEYTVYW